VFKKTIIALLFSGILLSKTPRIHPVVRSAILPGWGETTLGNTKRAKIFTLTEVTLWTACLGVYTFSYHQALVYESFASEHAGVDVNGKNHKYWVDIGNYIDLEHHNAEHLRWRKMDELYDQGDVWVWDSASNMKKFEAMRINSDLLAKRGMDILVAVAVNHIVSSIDALYLFRLKKIESVAVLPMFGKNSRGLKLQIYF